MTLKVLKVFHIVALCVFVGSIPAHIVLGGLAQSSQGAESFAALHQAKYALTVGLTGAGIAVTVVSGILLMLSRRALLRTRWLRLKLFLMAIIVFNGAAILTPLAEQMKDMALLAIDTGVLSSNFHNLENRESFAGAINLLLILTVLVLSVVKPPLRWVSREA